MIWFYFVVFRIENYFQNKIQQQQDFHRYRQFPREAGIFIDHNISLSKKLSCIHFCLMNLNKENIKDSVLVIIAWAIALSLVFLLVEKFKLLLSK